MCSFLMSSSKLTLPGDAAVTRSYGIDFSNTDMRGAVHREANRTAEINQMRKGTGQGNKKGTPRITYTVKKSVYQLVQD